MIHPLQKGDKPKQLLAAFGSFPAQMKSERHLSAAADFDASSLEHSDSAHDRRIIRVDIPPAHAGITAALRRAFAPVAGEPCDRDFHDRLKKLS
jgi:hypothetical protein